MDNIQKALFENNISVLALIDEFESLYDVDLKTGDYEVYLKGETFSDKVSNRLVEKREFFTDSIENVYTVVYPEDREEFLKVITPGYITKTLETETHIDWYYRLLVDGEPVWFKMRITYKNADKDHLIVGIFNAKAEMAEKKEKEQIQMELINRMVGDEGLFLINCEKDTRMTIHDHCHGASNYSDSNKYSELIAKYVDTYVAEYDREMMREVTSTTYMMERLKKDMEYTVEYRDLSTGIQRFYRMRVAKYSETEILQSFTERDKEIINSLIFKKMMDNYFALFAVDVDSGLMQILKKSPYDLYGNVGEVIPYESTIESLIAAFQGESKETLEKIRTIELLKQKFLYEDKATYTYKSNMVDITRWIDVTELVVSRHSDGTPSMITIGFSVLDTDASEREELQRLKITAAESQRIIENITSSYNIVYIVNMADDSLQIRRMDENMMESKFHFETFSDVRNFMLANVIHPKDIETIKRELDFNVIRKRLEKSSTYNVEYCIVKYGATIGGEMTISAIDKDKIIIGMAGNDIDFILHHLEEKRYEEYIALFVVDPDTEMIRVVKNNSWYKTPKIGEAVPYTEALRDFAKELDDEPREFFEQLSDINYVRREIAKEDKHTYSYKSTNPADQNWIDVTSFVVMRHEDGSPAMFTLGFTVTDSFGAGRHEVQSRLKEDMQMIGGLASGYHALYYFSFEDKSFKIYSIDGERVRELKNYVKEDGDPLSMFREFGMSELVHPNDRILFANISYDSVRARLAHSKKYTIRFRRNVDGEYLWTEMDIIKYEDINEPANAIAIGFAVRDNDIRRELEQQKQLEDARIAAEAANKSKSSFLFNMSHDIRTPMNAIMGFTTMAKKHVEDKDKVLEYLNKIDISEQQLLMLINQVLEMSRIEAGKLELEETSIDVEEKFNSMVTVLSEQAEVNGLEFHYSLENIMHDHIFADEARMSSITLNIAGNAMKYTPSGGRIDFKLKEIPCKKEDYATFVLTVADTGIGMNKEYLKYLFEPFSREKNSTVSRIQGTGLGMSIVKNLIDLMGGNIKVESEPGKGTRFDISVDFKIDRNATGEKAPVEEEKVVSFEGRRILLVEDNIMNREIAKSILEDSGFIIDEAEDGDIAVDIMEKLADEENYLYYDVILMDVQMPRMNGYDATKAIRAIAPDAGVHIPIIAMTANAFEEDRVDAINAGMDEHLAKPINVTKLLATLSKFL